MNWYLEQAVGLVILALLACAVWWEFTHLFEWNALMSGGKCAYLREHAYHYVTWVFGTDFGWVHR